MTDDDIATITTPIITRYAESFHEQVEQAENGWPAAFTFPEPNNTVERKALMLFILTVEQETGKKVKFTTQAGHA